MITPDDIRAAAERARLNADPGQVVFDDDAYAMPTTRWVTGPFSAALAATFRAIGVKYIANRWDCDDAAKLAAVLARICWAQSQSTGQSESALAFGWFKFWLDESSTGDAHLSNLFATRESGVVVLKFYEPQNCALFPSLSGPERYLCERIEF